jgi:hypothetical protein
MLYNITFAGVTFLAPIFCISGFQLTKAIMHRPMEKISPKIWDEAIDQLAGREIRCRGFRRAFFPFSFLLFFLRNPVGGAT